MCGFIFSAAFIPNVSHPQMNFVKYYYKRKHIIM